MDCSLDSEHMLEFQVNIFCNNRYITEFLHADDNDDDNAAAADNCDIIEAKAIAMPRVFSEYSRANKLYIIFPVIILSTNAVEQKK